MRICLLGVGKMGSWLAMQLKDGHQLAVMDIDPGKCQAISGCEVITDQNQIDAFNPQALINCVSLQNTIPVYRSVVPHLGRECLLCDVASIKGDLPEFYRQSGFRFVSLHPMFGPTFANIRDLQNENTVIISESDPEGKELFRELFKKLGVNIFEYSFDEHDRMMAYSLTLPFVSSMVFSSCVSTSAVPGTTFRKHLDVARGLLAEDDFLLAEIIFNTHSLAQLEKITGRLNFLWHIIRNRDTDEARRFFDVLRKNIKQ